MSLGSKLEAANRSIASKEQICIDALNHIAKVALAARVPTRRLDWIASRARDAKRGVPWNKDYLPEPRMQIDQDIADLRKSLRTLLAACETENLAAIDAAADLVKTNHPELAQSLRREKG